MSEEDYGELVERTFAKRLAMLLHNRGLLGSSDLNALEYPSVDECHEAEAMFL
jgi:hypothetical protein